MNTNPELIVMLTCNDCTVKNAYKIFDESKNSKAKYWGFKEKSLPLDEMKKLYSYMKQCGKSSVLEVVAYTEKECMEGAKIAVECGCDMLIGTTFFDSVNDFCKENNLKYMPFIGKITGRPSVLEGSIDDMLNEAHKCLEKGVYGFDLLGYRYTGDCVKLIENFVSNINAPVIIAGSVNSYKKLDELKNSAPWAFTICGAFFENKFEGTFSEQVNKVCEYMKK